MPQVIGGMQRWMEEEVSKMGLTEEGEAEIGRKKSVCRWLAQPHWVLYKDSGERIRAQGVIL